MLKVAGNVGCIPSTYVKALTYSAVIGNYIVVMGQEKSRSLFTDPTRQNSTFDNGKARIYRNVV
jgi:hypothetical protein